MALLVAGCSAVNSPTTTPSDRAGIESTASVEKISPIVAKPGEVVQVTGKDFSKGTSLKAQFNLTDGSSKDVELTVASPTSASFVMPEGVGLGLKSLSIVEGQSKKVAKLGLVANTADNQLPILIDDQSEICSTKQYIDRNGDQQTGTKNCASGVTPPACTENGSVGCVTTSTYKSADLTNLSAGHIKSGVTIAGTAGQYPSSSFKLTGSSGSDLTTPTFNAQIKSSGTFQYFGSDGVRYTGTGDTDITAANIYSGVDIFGATGSYGGGTVAPDAWNVRVGVTVNGVTGKLKVNCRNRVSTSSPTLYNYDGAIGSIGQFGQTGGSVRDIWDTIDDYNNGQVGGVPAGIVASWTSSTDCYGVESGAGDDNVWKDVTTTNGTTASTCTATPANCTMQDKITGISWSKLQASAEWNTAWINCQSLNYNGQTGWRLPTQKELMEAYTHGIRSIPSSYSAASTNWMTEANMLNNFWSGSSVSGNPGNAWFVYLANGNTDNYYGKSSTSQVVCVR